MVSDDSNEDGSGDTDSEENELEHKIVLNGNAGKPSRFCVIIFHYYIYFINYGSCIFILKYNFDRMVQAIDLNECIFKFLQILVILQMVNSTMLR